MHTHYGTVLVRFRSTEVLMRIRKRYVQSLGLGLEKEHTNEHTVLVRFIRTVKVISSSLGT